MRVKFHNIILLLATLLSVSISCRKEPHEPWMYDPSGYRKVVILYSAGHNSLAADLREDINDLASGSLAYIDYTRDALVIFSHLGRSSSSAPLCLIKVRNRNGNVMLDTLRTLPPETISVSGETMKEVLSYINSTMPAEEYDLIFSSHATGYLPAGYYSNSDYYEKAFSETGTVTPAVSRSVKKPSAVPYVEPDHEPGTPRVKSVGQDARGSLSYEMGIAEFAEALPMKFHSIIFDCCLMGGIEVAYELKDKCDYIVFSPTEIISLGMDYTSMGKRLFADETDLMCLCRDYFEMYDRMSGDWRSATVSLVDCSRLDAVAGVCSELFGKYREKIAGMPYSGVQQYFRYDYHWFYDLADIMANAGCTTDELARLDRVLDDCIIYKAATPEFIGLPIDRFCGFSMYLPSHRGIYGNGYLEEHYRELAWNRATGLVQ